MLTLTTRQQAVLAADHVTVSWRFIVTDSSGNYYFWSTKALDADASVLTSDLEGDALEFGPGLHGYNEEHGWDYEAKVINDFSIDLRDNGSENGLVAPNDLTLEIENAGNALTHSDFKGGRVWAALSFADETAEEVIRRWRFRVKKTEAEYQKIRLVCEDYLQKHLRGYWPNTRLVRDIFYSDDADSDDSVCVPVPIGTAYLPLRSDYIGGAITYTASTISFVASADGATCKVNDSADGLGVFEKNRYITITGDSEQNGTYLVASVADDGSQIELQRVAGITDEAAGDSVTLTMGSRYYVLGSPDHTYTITEVMKPKEMGLKGSVWGSGSYTFTQYTKADADAVNWRVFQAFVGDADNDGVADSPGLWGNGQYFYDMPTKLTRGDTAAKTGPAAATEFVLRDMGLSQIEIDLYARDAAEAVYTGWGLAWNGGWWFKQPRKDVLAQMMIMCHSRMIHGEQVRLVPRSKTSKATIDKSCVVKSRRNRGSGGSSDRGAGTFRYTDVGYDHYDDCGHIKYARSGVPIDRLFKILVPAKAVRTKISGDVLELPFIQDDQEAQKLGTLYYQRKLLRDADVSCTTDWSLAAIDPGDVATVNHADYGGTYAVIVESMRFRKDGSIDIDAYKLSQALDDWGDLAPDAVTVADDDSLDYWEQVTAGPLSDQDLGRRAYDVIGRPHLLVGPNTNQGDYTDIQDAVNALAESRHNGIFILNGTYPDVFVNLIDRDIEFIGESRGGVILQNIAGEDCFILHNLTKTFLFSNFTFDSQVSEAGHDKFYIYGDTYAQNTANITIEKIDFLLDDSAYNDYGMTIDKVSGKLITVRDCLFDDGYMGATVYSDIYASLKFERNLFTACQNGIHANARVKLDIIENVLSGLDQIAFWLPGTSGTFAIIGNHVESNPRWFVQADGNSANSIISKNTFKTGYGGTYSVPGVYANGSNLAITSNIIVISAPNVTGKVYGLYLPFLFDSVVASNPVTIDAPDTTDYHYGVYLANSDRNVVQGHQINMTNNDAKDIGIYLASTADNNQGGDNITYNCGIGIDDTAGGAGNAVTGQDV